MTTVIKNGTIVTADLTYKADVLIENGTIIEIGQNLSGAEELDATGCYVMPGGIDPHTLVAPQWLSISRCLAPVRVCMTRCKCGIINRAARPVTILFTWR